MPKLTLGHTAYIAYGDETDWLTYDGRRMLLWNELPEHIQNAWEAAANAVEAEVVSTGSDG